ncbi:MAG: SIR2 family protein [Succinivibrio sp.]|nr:SIR2 family protein [Succinivibrio sp.]
MQMVEGGPDLPEDLIRAQEEGRLAFFCGAGISVPAGLPDFKGLVVDLYRRCGKYDNTLECRMLHEGSEMLLNELTFGEDRVDITQLKKMAAAALQPQRRGLNSKLDTHKAIITLSQGKDGMHLVSTNFDCLFNLAIKLNKVQCSQYTAPLLPVPKPGRWNGIAYLHGRLPNNKGDQEEELIQNMVLTSADYGTAYISERWAARFVTDLMANYSVCFVGYSAGDLPIRYALDAMAAERNTGMHHDLKVWAFSEFDEKLKDSEKRAVSFWNNHGVCAIAYNNTEKHKLLHDTLRTWAEMAKRGSLAKASVVSQILTATSKGRTTPEQENQMRWALCDDTGNAANTFATFTPPANLKWLDVLSVPFLKSSSLSYFKLGTDSGDTNIISSLIRRPAAHSEIIAMTLCGDGRAFANTDTILKAMIVWLLNYLNSPRLLMWASNAGGVLHPDFKSAILDKIRTNFSHRKATSDVNQGTIGSEFISKPMRLMWQLLCAGKMRHSIRNEQNWRNLLLNQDNFLIRSINYRKLVEPRVVITNTITDKTSMPNDLNKAKDFFVLDVELAGELPPKYLIEDYGVQWFLDLWKVSNDALLECWQIQHDLGIIDNNFDLSLWYMPSIEPSEQNFNHSHWCFLIERVRDAILYLAKNDPNNARYLLNDWEAHDWPLYRRLWLYSAAHTSIIDCETWLRKLEQNNVLICNALYKREICRLLVKRGAELDSKQITRLHTLLTNKLNKVPEHLQSLYLEKLLNAQNNREVQDEDHREFSRLFEIKTLDPDEGLDALPLDVARMQDWLSETVSKDESSSKCNLWSRYCQKYVELSVSAMSNWLYSGNFDREYLNIALHAWSFSQFNEQSVNKIISLVEHLDGSKIELIVNELALWLEQAERWAEDKTIREKIALLVQKSAQYATSFKGNDINLDKKSSTTVQQVTSNGLMHPAAHIATTSLRLLTPSLEQYRWKQCRYILQNLNKGADDSIFVTGLVCCEMLPTIYFYDSEWACSEVLPLFNWDQEQAKYFWYMFLFNSAWYPDMLAAMKDSLLDTAQHFAELEDNAERYVFLLCNVFENKLKVIKETDWQMCFVKLPADGLECIFKYLRDKLKDAGNKSNYWKDVISPLWTLCQPHNKNRQTSGLAFELALLAAESGNHFQEAVSMVEQVPAHIDQADDLLKRLLSNGCCSKYPVQTLTLLSCSLDEHLSYLDKNLLRECLLEVRNANTDVSNERRFLKLAELCGGLE